MDYGQKVTDKELAALEQRIEKVYSDASKDLKKTIDEYFAKFVERDKAQQKLLEDGKITDEQYKQWRLNQIGRGERFKDLQKRVAERCTKANETAVAYVNDETPSIYTLNRNYGAYEIESVAGDVGFTMWDESTVRRLAVEEPDIMPYYPQKRAVNRGIDLDYGKRQISVQVTSSILQGHSIGKIANNLQGKLVDMNRASAIRTARTAVTAAQNGGRQASYESAEKMGIEMEKEWIATLDNRTRHSHAVLDGERVAVDGKFSNGCRYPSDPQGKPWEVYNCRCTMIANVNGVDMPGAKRRARNPETGEWETFYGSYQDWAASKKAENEDAWNIYMKKGKNLSADQKQYQEYKAVLGNKIPNTVDAFQEMKYNNTERWKYLKVDYARRNKLIRHPELSLPNADKAVAADAKFEGYLFNANNRTGFAKGKNFTNRLGYSSDNWNELKKEILTAATKYPTNHRGNNGYGEVYEQKIILYGKTDNPTNVVVGWIVKEDGVTNMTSAYIKEV